MTRIIVIGGGFGGTFAIRTLRRHLGPSDEILLFDPRDRFIFTPLLHEVAGGVLDARATTITYNELFSNTKRVKHIQRRISSIDPKHQTVTEERTGKKHEYDYLLIATGSRTDFRGKSFSENVLELKTYDDAVHVRTTIENNVRELATLVRNKHPEEIDDQKILSLLHCVIVGAGATGVELAGECIDLYQFRIQEEGLADHKLLGDKKPRVTLVQSPSRILPQMSQNAAEIAHAQLERKGAAILTNMRVVDISGTKITVEPKQTNTKGKQQRGTRENKKIETPQQNKILISSCIVWTAGIAPNSIPLHQTQSLDQQTLGTHFSIDDTLQVKGHQQLFAIGDVARINSLDEPLPALAQVASQQGIHAARNIMRSMHDKTLAPFTFSSKGMLVSVGQKYGVGTVKKTTIKGFSAWFLMRTIYLFKFKNTKQELLTAAIYTTRLFKRKKGYLDAKNAIQYALRKKKKQKR